MENNETIEDLSVYRANPSIIDIVKNIGNPFDKVFDYMNPPRKMPPSKFLYSPKVFDVALGDLHFPQAVEFCKLVGENIAYDAKRVNQAYVKVRNAGAERKINNKSYLQEHKELLSKLVSANFSGWKNAKKKEKRAAYRKIGVKIGKGIGKGLEMISLKQAA